jgi:alkylation response protein AidB-like acyl-CoA dehydrogenase
LNAPVDIESVAHDVRALAEEFSSQRSTRQPRRELERADFDRLRAAGFHLTGVPVEHGGLWRGSAHSTRDIAELLRCLAHGDTSIALVASMHPAVLFSTGWLTGLHAGAAYDERWQDQRRWAFRTVHHGAWWGTISSEPGSGGDTSKTQAIARQDAAGAWRLSGQKHFGSGSGITSYLITSALPEGENDVETFVLDVQNVAWDGSGGMRLTAPWNGCGMIATQSHAFSFEEFPVMRLAWPVADRKRAGLKGPAETEEIVQTFWAAITLGIVETAMDAARDRLAGRRKSMRSFEEVEWTRAEMEAWLIVQAYVGMLRAIESRQRDGQALLGKLAIAELAESTLSRICRIVGGSAYSHDSPFGYWFEDVRALGFLRPPWGLAYQTQFEITG